MDSGTAQAPIVYQAAPGRTRYSAADARSRAGSRAENGIWKTHIPEVAAGRWYFEQLFVNGNRATRARTPNKVFFYMQDLRETPLDPSAKPRKKGRAGRRSRRSACGRRTPSRPSHAAARTRISAT